MAKGTGPSARSSASPAEDVNVLPASAALEVATERVEVSASGNSGVGVEVAVRAKTSELTRTKLTLENERYDREKSMAIVFPMRVIL
jgi:hypothetical protein